MAEIGVAVAGGVLTAVVLNLRKMLSDNVKLMGDVKGKITRLERDLNWMHSFLKDAEKRQDDDRCLIRNWVSDVTDLAYEAEDIIDTFLIKLESEINTNTDTGKTGKCCICIPFIKKLPIISELGRQLQDLRAKSNDILSRRQQYGLTDLGSASTVISMSHQELMALRESSSNVNNEHMFGRDEDLEKLQNELNNKESGRFIISIFGMGGLGKTTLARNLYNQVNKSTSESFQYHAWICVSQSYTTEDLLRQLIKSMITTDEGVLKDLTTRRSLIDYLWNKLSESTFLVVLDDVWDQEAWESISEAFPNNNKNGRVIITTRKIEVAQVNHAFVHELKGLDEKNSWDLFCQKTIHYDRGNPDLKRLGEDMVSKCNGLPLAIIALGGVLSTKFNNIGEWEAVRDNIWARLRKKTPLIDAVLSLSFKDLSYPLRSCLLYVAMFPEDFEIPVAKLILVWEAEGLSKDEDSKSYFNELVGRSLLQTTSEDWFDSTCRVHDLVRDLAIRKAKEASLSKFYSDNEKFDLSETLTQRRLTMYDMDFNTIPNDYTNIRLRTMHLLLSDNLYLEQCSSFDKLLKSAHGRFGFLRVLDVKVEGNMTYVQVGKLIHLRYLGLKAGTPFSVSETLGDLKLLQTLYIASLSDSILLPESVVKLQNLKYLLGCFKTRGAMSDHISKLQGLKTLEIAGYRSWCDLDTTNLKNLQHLILGRMVGRWREKECYSPKFLQNFNNLSTHQLRTIDLITSSISVNEISKILERFTFLTHLRSFDTSKELDPNTNPDLFKFGTHLKVIEWFSVKTWNFQSFISSLEKLPRLEALRFSVENNTGSDYPVVRCSEKAFPQLRTLHIISYYKRTRVISMTVPESGMPLLRNLYVYMGVDLRVSERLERLIIKTTSF